MARYNNKRAPFAPNSNISPEAFEKFNEAALEVAQSPLLQLELGLVPVNNPDTGQLDEAARQVNLGILSEFAVEFSTFTLDLISSLDPFGDGVDPNTAFQEVERILTQELQRPKRPSTKKPKTSKARSTVVDVQGTTKTSKASKPNSKRPSPTSESWRKCW